jgi:hypothetical protein
MKATTRQLQAIHAILHSRSLLHQKANIIEGASNGRCTSSKDLTFEEAGFLIASFGAPVKADKPGQAMINKIFAIAHEMGWIPVIQEVQPDGKVKQRKDYSHLHAWILKYGYAKKPLNKYQYAEMPKLLTQFEQGPYAHWLKNK